MSEIDFVMFGFSKIDLGQFIFRFNFTWMYSNI